MTEIRMLGRGGQGAYSSAEMLAAAIVDEGKFATAFPMFGDERRGAQEILDSMIMAYRLAEDPEILLPVNVCFDGYYLSYSTERVELPYQEDVDAFLAPLVGAGRPRLCLEEPMTAPTNTGQELFAEWRYKHAAAQQRSKQKLEEIEGEFQAAFGRSYGGQIEGYRTEDAEIVMISMGSQTGAIREVVDSRRSKGEKN